MPNTADPASCPASPSCASAPAGRRGHRHGPTGRTPTCSSSTRRPASTACCSGCPRASARHRGRAGPHRGGDVRAARPAGVMDVRRSLATARVARFATCRPTGGRSLVPVWFASPAGPSTTPSTTSPRRPAGSHAWRTSRPSRAPRCWPTATTTGTGRVVVGPRRRPRAGAGRWRRGVRGDRALVERYPQYRSTGRTARSSRSTSRHQGLGRGRTSVVRTDRARPSRGEERARPALGHGLEADACRAAGRRRCRCYGGVGGPCGHEDGARHEEECDELSVGDPQGGHGKDSTGREGPEQSWSPASGRFGCPHRRRV